MTRDRQDRLAQFRGQEAFDLLVVGGGISGAGIALEAARAGLRVGLIEARDFASGTSSRSSKLVHGGLRYLKQGRIFLTRESVRERMALLADAPGLVEPLDFLLPIRRGAGPGRRVYGLGLAVYDLLAGARSRRWLNADELLNRMPALNADAVIGGWRYRDAQTDDARLVLRVLQEARSLGAATANYVRVEDWRRGPDGKICGVKAHDVHGHEMLTVNARCIVNAAGAWTDSLRRRLGGGAKVRPLRGSHLLFPRARFPLTEAIAFTHPEDGRAVFALPWEGAVVVGTTDLDHAGDLDREPAISVEETDYLMKALDAQFPSLVLKASDALSSWSGVRPVVSPDKSRAPSQEAREHFITDEDGVISVCGGKLTTFRSMALDVLKRAAGRLPQLKDIRPGKIFAAPGIVELPEHWPESLRRRMLGRHGGRLAALITCAEAGELSLIPDTMTPWAELRYACRHEQVMHLDDLLLRRTRLGLLLPNGARALLPRLQAIAATELGWDDSDWKSETERYLKIYDRFYSAPRISA